MPKLANQPSTGNPTRNPSQLPTSSLRSRSIRVDVGCKADVAIHRVTGGIDLGDFGVKVEVIEVTVVCLRGFLPEVQDCARRV